MLTLNEEVRAVCFDEGGYPDGWPLHASCPACGSCQLGDPFTKNEFVHVVCGHCGFVCVNPYPPEAIIHKIYNGPYYTGIREFLELPNLALGWGNTPLSVPTELAQQLVDLATAGRDSGSWLDVGGGMGLFCKFVEEQRPNWDASLNELSSFSIDAAREHGIKVLADDAPSIALAGRQFDVISTIAVLEHTPDPLAFLKSYAGLVKPGGRFIHSIPHNTPLTAKVSRGSYQNFIPPFHLSMFSKPALEAICRQLDGFRIVELWDYGPAAFSLLHHVQTGDYWDLLTPNRENPVPRAIQTTPYPDRMNDALNKLGQLAAQLDDYFAEEDGRIYLSVVLEKA